MPIKHLLILDFESYYDRQGCSLTQLSVPEYIFHPKFEVILLAAWDVAQWPAPRIIEADKIEAFLAQYPAKETLVVAHNALFDCAILAWVYGYVPARMTDTLGMARALRSYKRNSLGAVAKELFGFDSKGDTVHKVAGMNAQAIKNAGLWPDYCTYAMNDARLCAQIYFKLLDEFPMEERLIQDLVMRCGIEPVLYADVPLLQKHLSELRRSKQKLLNECGYEKAELMSTAQFKAVLESLGVPINYKQSATGNTVPAFAKSDPFMTSLKFYDQSDDDTNFKVQTLAAARLAHKSTIEETRAERFINVASLPWCNGHAGCPLLPVPLRYSGAHTHRLSGEWGMNLQNLPRDKTKSKLRSALLAPPKHQLITADLSQIEARLVAVLSGQTDLVEAFRNGEDVYAKFASIIFNRTINKTADPHERFLGKTAILSLGYSAGVDRFYQMVTTQAQQNNIPLEGLFDLGVAQVTVDKYRQTYRRIPFTWHKLDNLLQTVLLNPKPTKHNFGPVSFEQRRIELPNGMFLRYEGAMGTDLFGAKCLENLCQALARIIIMQTALRLHQRYHLRFCLQAHDELVFAVPDQEVEWLQKVILDEMVTPPTWLPDLPLAAEIGVGSSYAEAK